MVTRSDGFHYYQISLKKVSEFLCFLFPSAQPLTIIGQKDVGGYKYTSLGAYIIVYIQGVPSHWEEVEGLLRACLRTYEVPKPFYGTPRSGANFI